MTTTFPLQLQLANSIHGDAVSLERIQNEILRQSLEQIRVQSSLQNDSIRALELCVSELATAFKRRTAQWTPAKAISQQQNEGVGPSLQAVARQLVFSDLPFLASTSNPDISNSLGEAFCERVGGNCEEEDTGLYQFSGPKFLRKSSKPKHCGMSGAKALDEMSVQDIWNCYNLGEAVYEDDGCQTGLKPPLRLVEQHFQSKWRKSALVCF